MHPPVAKYESAVRSPYDRPNPTFARERGQPQGYRTGGADEAPARRGSTLDGSNPVEDNIAVSFHAGRDGRYTRPGYTRDGNDVVEDKRHAGPYPVSRSASGALPTDNPYNPLMEEVPAKVTSPPTRTSNRKNPVDRLTEQGHDLHDYGLIQRASDSEQLSFGPSRGSPLISRVTGERNAQESQIRSSVPPYHEFTSQLERQANRTSNHNDKSDIPVPTRMPQSQPSLSDLALQFAKMPYLDFVAVEKFISRNPEILKVHPQALLEEATRAFAGPEKSFARTCVQQAVVLKLLKDQPRATQHRILNDLKQKEDQVMGRFFEQRDSTWHEVVKASSNVALNRVPTVVGGSPQRPTVQYRPPETLPSISASPAILRGSRLEATASSSMGDDASRTSRVGQRTTATSNDRVQNPRSPVHDFTRDPELAVSRGSRDSSTQPPLLPIHGNDTLDSMNTRQLDMRYVVRPSIFYKPGRVFAVLWHEPGMPWERPTSNPASYAGAESRAPLGEAIYSAIRRMVVVRQDHGFSVCIAINSYAGRGLSKFRNSPRDIHAHSRIYKTGDTPDWVKDEPQSSRRDIEVNVMNDQRFPPSSRLCYSRPYTVEHTVKSLDVGEIAEASLPYVLRYFQLVNSVASE
ncbi:uncharacterized protein A1O5_10587 [Cladophialophora psammophila CBS 110553]|uniref:DUF6590 domain-containing protein n=1 Tax=Cladophialophora psammophila CBS 110553 TaxID=1182543 RepID=W9WN58_9EURO|nr:uncharacterized protein A1O5_10587 [Cladophialophora psammophila CBS 110553]EXJ66435.1 hypothetical protein A1O5_10587 [Cladophialophora psammophila CBS 110553]